MDFILTETKPDSVKKQKHLWPVVHCVSLMKQYARKTSETEFLFKISLAQSLLKSCDKP